MKSLVSTAKLRWVLLSAASLTALAGPAVAATGDKAGIAAAVRGEVRQSSFRTPAAVGRVVASGDEIFLGDRIESGAKSGMQVILMDETVLTLGPNAALVIDEFVYDPQTDAGELAIKVAKGAFRFVSGRIAAKDAEKVRIETPVASIGVRGTTILGWTDGSRAEFVLTSVGANNNTGDKPSRLLVTSQGVTRTIHRTGFGVTVPGLGQTPDIPARVPPGRIAALVGNLAGPSQPPAPPAGEDGGTAAPGDGGETAAEEETATEEESSDVETSEESGETAAEEESTEVQASDEGGETGTSEAFGDLTTEETAVALVDNSGQSTATALDPAATEGEITTLVEATEGVSIQDSVQSPTGIIDFPAVTVTMTGVSAEVAKYTFVYKIDLGNRSFAGNVTMDAISGFATNGTGVFPLLTDPFAADFGTINEGGTVPTLGGNINVQYTFDEAAGGIFHSVDYSDSGSASGNGFSAGEETSSGGASP